MQRITLVLLCSAAVAALTLRSADAEPSLGIGSKAPALAVEHYLDETDAPITKFKKGNVYVVEFWATWCRPCINSMPHLAELQTKFRKDGVQIISISDESVDEVEALLKKPYPQKEASFAEVTAPYTLTTDPDRSVFKDYMEASNQRGIPTAFIVGKSGIIEWIGHPGEMEEPLTSVVDGSWDREAYKEKMEREKAFEEAIQTFAQLAGRGKLEEAGKMLDQQIASAKDKELKERWIIVQHQFNLMTGQATESDLAFYRKDLADRAGNPPAVYQHAMTLYGLTQNGGEVGPLAAEAIVALNKEIEAVDDSNKAAIYEAIARLHSIDKHLEQAIAAQEKAVELSEGLSRSLKNRMTLFLDELKSTGKEDADKASDK